MIIPSVTDQKLCLRGISAEETRTLVHALTMYIEHHTAEAARFGSQASVHELTKAKGWKYRRVVCRDMEAAEKSLVAEARRILTRINLVRMSELR